MLIVHKPDGLILVYDGEVHTCDQIWDSECNRAVGKCVDKDVHPSVVDKGEDLDGHLCVYSTYNNDFQNAPYNVFKICQLLMSGDSEHQHSAENQHSDG